MPRCPLARRDATLRRHHRLRDPIIVSPPRITPSRFALVAVLPTLTWLSLSGVGCKGCDRDRPYVPITLGASSGTTTTTPSSLPAPVGSLAVDGGTFARVISTRPPPGATSWTLDGVALVAPPGRVFLAGLTFAIEGGQRGAAAIVGDGGSMAGEVVVFRPDPAGRLAPVTLAPFPAWLPVGQGCTHNASLAQVGVNTLWVDVASTCERPDASKPGRWLASVSMSASPAVRTDLRVLPPAPGELLRADADAADRDGDGQDDLVLQLTLELSTPPTPGAPSISGAESRASVSLKYIDRASGLARESDDPAPSLKSQAMWFGAQAAKAATAANAARSALTFRKLFRAVCSEGGAPSVFAGDGSPISCHDTSSLEDARYAEARAALSLNEIAKSISIAARFGEGGTSRRGADFEKALTTNGKVVKAKAVPLKAQPVAWSVALPMAFQADGSLIVRTAEGAVRVDPTSAAESPAPSPASWSASAELAGDLKVVGAHDPCTSAPIDLLVAAGSAKQSRATNIAGGSAPRCTATGPQLLLLDRNGDGLVAMVQGEAIAVSSDGEKIGPVAFPTGAAAPGSIRSPDGASTALTQADRVIVASGGKYEIWKPSPHFTLTGCTVANGSRAVACVLERGIVLMTP